MKVSFIHSSLVLSVMLLAGVLLLTSVLTELEPAAAARLGAQRSVAPLSLAPQSQWNKLQVVAPANGGAMPYVGVPLRCAASYPALPGNAPAPAVFYVSRSADAANPFFQEVVDGDTLVDFWQGETAHYFEPDSGLASFFSDILPLDLFSAPLPTVVSVLALNGLWSADSLYSEAVPPRIYFDMVSETAVQVHVDALSDADMDANGVPDGLAATVLPGIVWAAQTELRAVQAADLDVPDDVRLPGQPEQTFLLAPSASVAAALPNRDAFVDAGLVSQDARVLGVVQLADTLDGLFDGSISAEALNALHQAPGAALGVGPYLAVHYFQEETPGAALTPMSGWAPLAQYSFAAPALPEDVDASQITLWRFPIALDAVTGLYAPDGTAWQLAAGSEALASDGVLTLHAASDGILLPRLTVSLTAQYPVREAVMTVQAASDTAMRPLSPGTSLYYAPGEQVRVRLIPRSPQGAVVSWIVNEETVADTASHEIVLTLEENTQMEVEVTSLRQLTLLQPDGGRIEVVSPEPETCGGAASSEDAFCFTDGAEITLRAQATNAAVSVLTAWQGDGVLVDSQDPAFGETYTFILNQDMTVSAAFNQRIQLTRLNLDKLPFNRSVPVALLGVFPTYMFDVPANAEAVPPEDAELRYTVELDGEPLSYHAPADTPYTAAGEGITLWNKEENNRLHVWTPALIELESKAADLVLRVQDKLNPLNYGELSVPRSRFFETAVLSTAVLPGNAPGEVLVSPLQSVIPGAEETDLRMAPMEFVPGDAATIAAVPPDYFALFRIETEEDVREVKSASYLLTVLEDTRVIAMFNKPAYKLTLLDSPQGSIIATPVASSGLPPYWFYEDAEVYVRAVPANGYRFVMWTGAIAGETQNPAELDMSADREVGALFLPPQQAALHVAASEDGVVDVRPLGGVIAEAPGASLYPLNTPVKLYARANVGYRFQGWEVNTPEGEAPLLEANPLELTMDRDYSVTPLFQKVFTLTVESSPETGGTVAITPPMPPAGYDEGTEVTLEAIPDAAAGYRFVSWSGGRVLPNSTTARVRLLMDSDLTITATFSKVSVISAAPAEAWVFGGVVVKIQGTALSPNARVYFGKQEVVPLEVAPSGSFLLVAAPVFDGTGDEDRVKVGLSVEDQGYRMDYAPGFTYKRRSQLNGVYTSAFILSDAGAAQSLRLGRMNDKDILCNLPRLGEAPLYGLVRFAASGALAASRAGAVPGMPGSAISGLYDMGVHFYAPRTDAAFQPQHGVMIYEEITPDLFAFRRPYTQAGLPEPLSAAMTISMAVDKTAPPTYDVVRSGLTCWGVNTTFDYVSGAESVLDATPVYQSMLLNREVTPENTAAMPGSDLITGINEARIYGGTADKSANCFTWRQGAALSAQWRSMVQLVAVNNRTVSGTGAGPVGGGTALTLVSPYGGLGWLDAIELDGTKSGVGGEVAENDIISLPGTDEFRCEFRTPKSAQPGTADIVLKTAADPASSITLAKVFEYTRPAVRWWTLFLILMGLMFAAIGAATSG